MMDKPANLQSTEDPHRELARALPAPGNGNELNLDALIYDNGVFEELED